MCVVLYLTPAKALTQRRCSAGDPFIIEEYFEGMWSRTDAGHTLTNSTQVQCLFLPALSTAEQTQNRAVGEPAPASRGLQGAEPANLQLFCGH